MAEPTVVSYANSTLSDAGDTDESVASVSWQAGDIVIALGLTSNNTEANHLATPTATGLTFSLIGSVNNDTDNNAAQLFLWSATAAGSGTQTITSVTTNSGAVIALRNTLAILVIRGSDGLGTPVAIDTSAAKTIGVTRAQANSHVVCAMVDWNAINDVVVDATPTGTVRLASFQTGQATFFICSYGDQGATGTTSYGITNHTGTVSMSGLAVEIKGSSVSPAPTISSATPSGTLGTSTSATLGATTDQTSGTFYGVVDSTGNISGITASQVKAAQNNAGAAPVSSGNSSVSTSSPSAGMSGLTAATLYSYAVVQNNANGDSNVLTGTFTTAAAASNRDVRKFGPQGFIQTLLTM